MTFGPDEILACPRCGAPQRTFTLRSANGLGASWWTDGFQNFPMCWKRPFVSRCASCRRFYWVAEARHLGFGDCWLGSARAGHTSVPSERATAGRVHELSLDACLDALAAGTADTPEREHALRTLAWWRSSDRNRRWRKKKVRQKTPQDRSNADALRGLLGRRFDAGGHPAHALLLVELERQLGRLDEARRWLGCAAAHVVVDDPGDDGLVEPLGSEPDLPVGAGWIGEWTGPRELRVLSDAQARLLAAAHGSVEAVRFGDAASAPPGRIVPPG